MEKDSLQSTRQTQCTEGSEPYERTESEARTRYSATLTFKSPSLKAGQEVRGGEAPMPTHDWPNPTGPFDRARQFNSRCISHAANLKPQQ